MLQGFLSRRIVTPAGTRAGALLIASDRIVAVCNKAEVPAEATLHDCNDLAILPGLVDTHVHLNEPGRTEWEGFRTGTSAAAAGGYTLLVDMPLNCLPETTTAAHLQAKRQAAQGQCLIDWAAWGGVVADNQSDVLPLARAGVPGFKCFLLYPGCEGFTMVNRAQLEAALPHVVETGLPLLVHAELAEPIEAAANRLHQSDWTRYETYLASRPDSAELTAMELLIELCRRYRFRLHIVHLSTAEALPMLGRAREEGLPISVETCPHYLYFAAEQVADRATLHKCAPPIRNAANRELLWQALGSGGIDLVATDHSPCPPAMKGLAEGRWDLAWGGIASLSVALPVVHTEARKRGYSLDDLVRWMAAAPAKLAGFDDRAGSLLPGREASFVLFDTEAIHTVAAGDLHFRHAISPYVGETLTGKVHSTWLRGAAVYEEGKFSDDLRGCELTIQTPLSEVSCSQPNMTASPTTGNLEENRSAASAGVLTRWNSLSREEAACAILSCCGSRGWADAMGDRRPFHNEVSLLDYSDQCWAALSREDWQQAFDSHPRLGEARAKTATASSIAWSRREQRSIEASADLRDANARYEQRFGHIFLLCANGRSTQAILEALEARMGNKPEAEWHEAGEQQRKITRQRLQRWVRGE